MELIKNWTLRKIDWTENWEVDEEFLWKLSNWYFVQINKWFISNFWSIPQFLWIFFDPTRYIWYLLHDQLYTNPYCFKRIESENTTYFKKLTRRECDLCLIESLYLEWCPFFERLYILIWVRIWGWLFFNKNNKKINKKNK